MSRVLTFSRTFPSYHPRAGEPTDFVCKIWESIYLDNPEWLGEHLEQVRPFYPAIGLHGVLPPKHHTIRTGHRWKAGDFFSPRVWSGKPYNSKQITFAPDIEVKKVWDFEINDTDFFLKKWYDYAMKSDLDIIAMNDGLTTDDFAEWFWGSPEFKRNKGTFDGQVICWNENINY